MGYQDTPDLTSPDCVQRPQLTKYVPKIPVPKILASKNPIPTCRSIYLQPPRNILPASIRPRLKCSPPHVTNPRPSFTRQTTPCNLFRNVQPVNQTSVQTVVQFRSNHILPTLVRLAPNLCPPTSFQLPPPTTITTPSNISRQKETRHIENRGRKNILSMIVQVHPSAAQLHPTCLDLPSVYRLRFDCSLQFDTVFH